MRDPKLPQDDYNKRLHIYAETPGLQLLATAPSSEKELNTPETSQEISSSSLVQTHPYARIPVNNFEEEEPTPSNAANTFSISSSASYEEDTGSRIPVQPRDPIYAELSHPICEDDQVERTGEKESLNDSAHPIIHATSSSAAESGSATPQRLKGTTESTATGDARSQSRENVSSLSKESQLLQGSREKYGNTKAMCNRTRVDACHGIAATPRTMFSGAEDKDGGGVLLISKTDRNPDFASGSEPQSGEKGGIFLKYVKPLEETLRAEPDGELEAGRVAMPIDHDLDAGTAILKKKRRFRRNMLLIISFLLILLIVVAAVIIALVVVTKG